MPAPLLKAEEKTSPKFEELHTTMLNLCIKSLTLWIPDELSAILLRDLRTDDGLSSTTPLRVTKHDLYPFLLKSILQNFASSFVGEFYHYRQTKQLSCEESLLL